MLNNEKFQNNFLIALSGFSFFIHLLFLGSFLFSELNNISENVYFIRSMLWTFTTGTIGILIFTRIKNYHQFSYLDRILKVYISVFLFFYFVCYLYASFMIKKELSIKYYVKLLFVVFFPFIISMVLPLVLKRQNIFPVYKPLGILNFLVVVIFTLLNTYKLFIDKTMTDIEFYYKIIYLVLGFTSAFILFHDRNEY